MKLFRKLTMLKKGAEVAASGGIGGAVALVGSAILADGENAFSNPDVQSALGVIFSIVFAAAWRMFMNWRKNRD